VGFSGKTRWFRLEKRRDLVVNGHKTLNWAYILISKEERVAADWF